MAGVTDQGFVAKTLEDITAELEAQLKQAFGDSVDLTPNEPLGQLQGITADREAELWDLAQAVYKSFDPDSATGATLTTLAALTGTTRLSAASSRVTLTLTGTPATLVASGKQASVTGTGTKFDTQADATITLAASWANTHAYVLGDRITLGSKIYECITAGTSAGSGGPTGTALDITDGTVHWHYIGAGTGWIDVLALSDETGPKIASAGTLTVIETSVGGWQSVYNALDAVLGRDEESDPALRARRETELHASGTSALDALRRALLNTANVTTVTVFENTTLVTDADGIPGKAVECLVQGGDTETVRAAVFANKAAGIQAYGTDSGTVTDSQGQTHTVAFSRPTAVIIYVIQNLTIDATAFPADGQMQLQNALAAYGQTVLPGKDVVASRLTAIAFSISGVLDCVTLISKTPTTVPVASTTVAIGLRELADYDTSRITINTTPGTP